jgi:hypothetical protein
MIDLFTKKNTIHAPSEALEEYRSADAIRARLGVIREHLEEIDQLETGREEFKKEAERLRKDLESFSTDPMRLEDFSYEESAAEQEALRVEIHGTLKNSTLMERQIRKRQYGLGACLTDLGELGGPVYDNSKRWDEAPYSVLCSKRVPNACRVKGTARWWSK